LTALARGRVDQQGLKKERPLTGLRDAFPIAQLQ